MAVGVVMDLVGATLQQYDEVIDKMGLQPGGPGPSGLMFHWVAATDDGIRVTDVWQSAEQFQQFADEQIGPFTAEVGVPAPPTIAQYDVHSHLTAG